MDPRFRWVDNLARWALDPAPARSHCLIVVRFFLIASERKVYARTHHECRSPREQEFLSTYRTHDEFLPFSARSPH